jgi:hypothetical protein
MPRTSWCVTDVSTQMLSFRRDAPDLFRGVSRSFLRCYRSDVMPRTCSGVCHGRFYGCYRSDVMPRTCSGVGHGRFYGAIVLT